MNDAINGSDRAVRRFLEDLRSGVDRRSWEDRREDERRGNDAPVEDERRGPDDRRNIDRRDARERRASQWYAFTERETMEIYAMFADPQAEVACPRCGGPLILADPEGGASGVGRDVICTGCRGRLHIPDSAVTG